MDAVKGGLPKLDHLNARLSGRYFARETSQLVEKALRIPSGREAVLSLLRGQYIILHRGGDVSVKLDPGESPSILSAYIARQLSELAEDEGLGESGLDGMRVSLGCDRVDVGRLQQTSDDIRVFESILRYAHEFFLTLSPSLFEAQALTPLQREILPPDWMERSEYGLTGTGRAVKTHRERLEFLRSLLPLAEYVGLQGRMRQYFLFEFPGLVIADSPTEGNALYSLQCHDDRWKQVFRGTKSNARADGAQKIVHSATWPDRVRRLVSLARQSSE